MKTYKYEIGDKIKLKDYDGKGEQQGFNRLLGWFDWQRHKGQIAEIITIVAFDSMDYRIRWNNGETSCIPEHNVVLYGKPLLRIQEYLNQYKR